jgi:hypothetical protein
LAAQSGTIALERRLTMAEPQLFVRSARARDLAHRLAGREPAEEFYRRTSLQATLDIDLDSLIRVDGTKKEGPELGTCGRAIWP